MSLTLDAPPPPRDRNVDASPSPSPPSLIADASHASAIAPDASHPPSGTVSAGAHAALCMIASADDTLSITTGSADANRSDPSQSACPSPRPSEISSSVSMPHLPNTPSPSASVSVAEGIAPVPRESSKSSKSKRPRPRPNTVPDVMDEAKLIMYKTEFCHRERGVDQPCRFGALCDFAHSLGELRRNLKAYKYVGVMCQHAQRGEECPDKAQCGFCHNEYEYYFHPTLYKRFACPITLQGAKCPRKYFCPYDHQFILSQQPLASPVSSPPDGRVPAPLPSPTHAPPMPTFVYPNGAQMPGMAFAPPFPVFAMQPPGVAYMPSPHGAYPPFGLPMDGTSAAGAQMMAGPQVHGQFLPPLPLATEDSYRSHSLPSSARRFFDDSVRYPTGPSAPGSAVVSPHMSATSSPRSGTSASMLSQMQPAGHMRMPSSRRSSIPNLMSPTRSTKASETPLSDMSPGPGSASFPASTLSTQPSTPHAAGVGGEHKMAVDLKFQVLNMMDALSNLQLDQHTKDLYEERQRLAEQNRDLASRLATALQRQARAEQSLASAHSLIQQVSHNADEDIKLLLGDPAALDTISQTALFRLTEINKAVGAALERCKERRATQYPAEAPALLRICKACGPHQMPPRQINCVLMPCRHQALCHECARAHPRCPICKEAVTGSLGLRDERVNVWLQQRIGMETRIEQQRVAAEQQRIASEPQRVAPDPRPEQQ